MPKYHVTHIEEIVSLVDEHEKFIIDPENEGDKTKDGWLWLELNVRIIQGKETKAGDILYYGNRKGYRIDKIE